MGQEVVYCFKCQKRITSTDFAKGQAYQVENNFCCSACAVGVLETLPPKAKEQLLAKMFKATHDRQSSTSGGSPSASSTGRIPHATPRPMKVAEPSSSGPLIAGVVGAIVAVILVVVFLSSGSTPPPPPPAVTPKAPPPVVKVDSGPTAEEKRAKEAMTKAREFAITNPKDLEGQLRQWRAALAENERTGYEAEARRETEKAESRIKEAVAQELADLERQARDLASKRDFKAALELVDRARPKRSTVDWTSRIDALRRDLEERSLAGPPWRPIFDGRTNGFVVSLAAQVWHVDDGALTRDLTKPDQAAQSREDFGDGEFRFRFVVEKVSGFFFTIRQAAGGAGRVAYSKPMANALSAGPHDLVFTCRGTQISATLDGTSIPVAVEGTVPPRGRLQFNFSEGSFRLLAVEMRDLP